MRSSTFLRTSLQKSIEPLWLILLRSVVHFWTERLLNSPSHYPGPGTIGDTMENGCCEKHSVISFLPPSGSVANKVLQSQFISGSVAIWVMNLSSFSPHSRTSLWQGPPYCQCWMYTAPVTV